MSANPAALLGLPRKGRLEKGQDGDVMVLDEDLRLRTLVGRGRVMMRDGEVLARGTFEPQEG